MMNVFCAKLLKTAQGAFLTFETENALPNQRKISLQVLLPVLAILLTLAMAGVLWAIAKSVIGDQEEKEISENLLKRTSTLAVKIDRALYERYQNISLHARLLVDYQVLGQPQALGRHLDALKQFYEGYAWIGYAGRDGKVLAASDGLLEGEDVSQRPWYAAAIKADYISDPHRALLLEKKLNEDGAEPLRFLDIAIPVVAHGDGIVGVLGAHIDWRWIESVTKRMPMHEQSEFMIVASNKTVLLGPSDLQDNPLPAAMAQSLENTKSGYWVARWPDGNTYLTAYSRSDGYRNYAGLNWYILERQRIELAYAPIYRLLQQLMLWSLVVAGLFALAGWITARRITKPLLVISRVAENIEHGDTRAKIPFMRTYREVAVLAGALSRLIAQLTQREAELEHLATHSALTQLPNRTLAKALLEQAILLARQGGNPLAVMAVGFEGYRRINSTLGGMVGDALILEISRRLQAASAHATLCHLGEDEFLLIVHDHDALLMLTTSISSAITDACTQPFMAGGTPYYLRPSMGVSQYPKDGADAGTLLGNSEIALHEAQTRDGRHIEFYEATMNSLVLQRIDMERELRAALMDGQLELHYQPLISLADDRLAGVEALIRWRHPERGYTSPAQFIPVAEATGLILPIGDWVLHEACRQAALWREAGFPPFMVAVNVSSRQFAEGNLLECVKSALSQHGLQAQCLKIEITESMLMQDADRAIMTMQELIRMGVHIAIDDFGTGYSSLSYLGKFPINELKIDQSFVRNLMQDGDNATIVRAIISLARSLKLGVIAEGVETAAQADFLKHAGCNVMQGYYFSKPLDSGAMTKLLHARHGNEGQAA